MSKLADARRSFREEFGYPAKREDSAEVLLKKIEDRNAHIKAQEESRAKEEAERQLRRQEAVDRVDARGPLEEFIVAKNDYNDESESEKNLRWLMRRIVMRQDSFKETQDKFFEDVAKNPLYAMSWSASFFDRSAEHEVGKNIIVMFENGATFEGIIASANKKVMNMARSASNYSTSPTSNLATAAEMKAWADIVDRIF